MSQAVLGRPQIDAMAFPILISLSASHMMNDTMQSVIQALYPMFRQSYQLSYGQIGLITLAFQLTASILQPLVGLYTDRRPLPYSLTAGMGSTLIGLLLLSRADSFLFILGSRGPRRHRELGVPPGKLSGGAHGVRRPFRLCAGVVPGGRQYRLVARSACWRPSWWSPWASTASATSR